MLLYLHESLNIDTTDVMFSDIRRALQLLLFTGFEGNHIIRGDLELLKKLRKNEDLSIEARLYADKLYHNSSTMQVPLDLSFYIEVVKEVVEEERYENGQTIRQVPYTRFLKSAWCQKSVLIGENDNDCTYYTMLAEWYLADLYQRTTNKIPITFDKRGGGGSTICQHIKQVVGEENRIAMCITDTDRKYPNAPIETNSTYAKASHLYRSNPTYRFVDVDVHETENLLPFHLIDSILGPTSFPSQNRKHFEYLRDNDDQQKILQYFDITILC